MKRYLFVFVVAVLSAALVVGACDTVTPDPDPEEQKDQGDDQGGNQGDENGGGQGDEPGDTPADPEPPKDDDTHINGTELLAGMNGVGLVMDAATGKGIPDVPVTDGYKFTATDANGVYQMRLDGRARNVYISVPAAYKIPLDPQRHAPLFYSTSKIDTTKCNRNDFTLEPLEAPETEFTLVVIGDPQCQTSKGAGYFTKQHGSYPGTVPDIQATVNEGLASGEYKNVYAITLGDIVFDSSNMWDTMRNAMSNVSVSSGWLPFFQCIGNHDHCALTDNDYDAAQHFIDHFGPTDYSFDRGDAHVVVMDDMNVVRLLDNAKYPDKKTWSFFSGFVPDQWEWLKQDLALVRDKEHKMLIFCAHVPFRAGCPWPLEGSPNIITFCYHGDILSAMTEFHSAELMTGHTHYPACYIHKDYVCKGGRPVMEHVHQAACGGWWNCHSSVTGGPNGYTIYSIKGADVVDWTNKGTGRSKDYQLRVYDGNQLYGGTRGYKVNWYDGGAGGPSSIPIYGNQLLQGCFVAEVWDDDDTWWTVEFFRNGVKEGDFSRLPDGSTSNVALASYAFNELGKDAESWADRTHSHYWSYKAESGEPSLESGWEVVVTHTIPGSGLKRVFRRDKLTVDYSEF